MKMRLLIAWVVLAMAGARLEAAKLPGNISMNQDAGRGEMIFVTVRLGDGEKLPFVLDTGCPTTCLDQSLEPELGRRIRTETLWAFGVASHVNYYSAPRLYLGNTRLMKSGALIVTHDCRQMSAVLGRPIMGILGMDVLHNYCVQLDFKEHEIRFLDYRHASKKRWGKAFPLTPIADGCCVISNNLVGAPGVGSMIDTGCNYDGWLIPQLYQEWTETALPPAPGLAHAPNGILNGAKYPDLDLRGVATRSLATGDTHVQFNGLGLQFLARHLVTLDFPEQTLYLRRRTVDAPDEDAANAAIQLNAEAAAEVLKELEQRGQLPGWSKEDQLGASSVTFHLDPEAGTATFDMPRKGDRSIYHYTLTRPSGNQPWRLKKAWRTDPTGRDTHDYPVP